MPKDCPLCSEKDRRINAILKGYRKDKKIYRIVIISLFVLVILILAFGPEGILVGLNFAKEIKQ